MAYSCLPSNSKPKKPFLGRERNIKIPSLFATVSTSYNQLKTMLTFYQNSLKKLHRLPTCFSTESAEAMDRASMGTGDGSLSSSLTLAFLSLFC